MDKVIMSAARRCPYVAHMAFPAGNPFKGAAVTMPCRARHTAAVAAFNQRAAAAAATTTTAAGLAAPADTPVIGANAAGYATSVPEVSPGVRTPSKLPLADLSTGTPPDSLFENVVSGFGQCGSGNGGCSHQPAPSAGSCGHAAAGAGSCASGVAASSGYHAVLRAQQASGSCCGGRCGGSAAMTATPVVADRTRDFPAGAFAYDAFFQEQVEAKRRDRSYRVFNNVNRIAGAFPAATHLSTVSLSSAMALAGAAAVAANADGPASTGSSVCPVTGQRDPTGPLPAETDPACPVTASDRGAAQIHPRDVTVWCSNDYLGLGQHPEVLGSIKAAVDAHGAGAGGTRNIAGTSAAHLALEKRLAELHRQPAALVFQSCYVANDTALATLGAQLAAASPTGRCIFYSDALNHASMIHGMRHAGPKAHRRIFRHNDVAHLEELLEADAAEEERAARESGLFVPGQPIPRSPRVVVFESVYSMCGTVGPIADICKVAQRHGALTFLDEVHAVGLYGATGAGVAERDGLMDQVDIVSGTLGKAFGNVGGYIAGSHSLIDTLRSYAPGFIFTTAMPPHVAAGALAAVELSASPSVGGHLRQFHGEAVADIKSRLMDLGIPVLANDTHIVPVMVYDAALARRVSDHLLHRYGIYVQAINQPTVARGAERLRVTPSPVHTTAMRDHFVEAMDAVWRDFGLPRVEPGTSVTEFWRPDFLQASDAQLQVLEANAAPIAHPQRV
ncbi:hypothetical protein H696_03482 [Fonticula alba]|uniref:Aminotransferase class I/classII large domain-containing protein n=1 Tax=Fonticula alba TaxID=691883 RepID=A0A058Z6Z5_FONAL|nr:hypothetical protein H696_03482 [Fonticula alba]KCV70015.1 hypothetical protein H696_03482 [Fonticula alba]|eukprot:XP_009495621.1 hypothetical protein H696_03482 [Fonticula alba]